MINIYWMNMTVVLIILYVKQVKNLFLISLINSVI